MVPISILAAVAVAVAFFGLYRPWHLKWGATREELAESTPPCGRGPLLVR